MSKAEILCSYLAILSQHGFTIKMKTKITEYFFLNSNAQYLLKTVKPVKTQGCANPVWNVCGTHKHQASKGTKEMKILQEIFFILIITLLTF